MNYGYARVSTKIQAKDGNSLEAQEKLLRDSGADIIFRDSFTGTISDRPELNKLLAVIQPGDTLIVAKLDRIARSVESGIKIINCLVEKDVVVKILNIGTIDNTATGKLIRNIFLAFAEFERDMIVQRTQEGKAIAKQKSGYKEGRPKIYSEDQLKAAVKYKETHTIPETLRVFKISKATLYRAIGQYKVE